MRPVSEADRISIAERLENFRGSQDTEMTFEAGLSNHDRAIVHDLCRKHGLVSKSQGKGDERRVTVSKPRDHLTQTSSGTLLSFSPESQVAIYELMLHFPPTELELTSALGEAGAKSEVVTFRVISKSALSKPKQIRSGVNETNNQALALASRLQKMPALQQMAKERSKLPIACFREMITQAVDNNQVVLIAGQTGCGKTTQVPQFILDHAWEQGKPCRVLCTQPRRISATSVAERIASERGEPIGQTVGYQIRLESKGGPHSSLMLCTTGVLLRKLVQLGTLESGSAFGEDDDVGLDATHIIVDEIHERDRYADFMLIILRDLLPKLPDLRLILMSATLNSELYSDYFGGCPIVEVPGFTHPVKSYYLEDVLNFTGYGVNGRETPTNVRAEKDGVNGEAEEVREDWTGEDAAAMDDAISRAWMGEDFDLLMLVVGGGGSKLCNYGHSETGSTPLMVAAGKGRKEEVEELLAMGADHEQKAFDGSCAMDWAQHFQQEEIVAILQRHAEKKEKEAADVAEAAVLKKYQMSTDQEETDIVLIEGLLQYICSPTNTDFTDLADGAILVFVPGWDDISRLREKLQSSPLFGNSSKFTILPLHSQVPSLEQRKVFQRPPKGVRKIVLATNIAETAITIDDVVFVIDTGRAKEKSYDPYSNVSTLQMTWISRASARQREGRAGRVRPGVCYHLFSKTRAAALPEFQVPEIKRTPLEELCLQVKLLNPNLEIREFIGKAIEAPVDAAVKNAIELLQDIGALSTNEKLTELGQQLGSLPLHPTVSKMLLHAVLLNCLDPALTIASATTYRDPFVLPMSPMQKQRALDLRQQLANMYGGGSDHLALIAAFEMWEGARRKGKEQEFCSQYFVSGGTMNMLAGMRRQLQGELCRKGFISSEDHACSSNAQNPGIIRAVLAAGMYPMVGSLLPPLPGGGGRNTLVQTARGEKARIHPHSTNSRFLHQGGLSEGGSKEASAQPLLVFDEVTRGESLVTIRSSTVVKPHSLVLIVAEMVVCAIKNSEDDAEEGKKAEEEQKAQAQTAPPEAVEEEEEEEEEEEPESDDDAPLKPNPLSKEERAKREQDELMSDPERRVVVVLDRWLRFETTAFEAAQLFCLRERLAAAFAFRVKYPKEPFPPIYAVSLYTIACMLSYEGVLNIPPPVALSSMPPMGSPMGTAHWQPPLLKAAPSAHILPNTSRGSVQAGPSRGGLPSQGRGQFPAGSVRGGRQGTGRGSSDEASQGLHGSREDGSERGRGRGRGSNVYSRGAFAQSRGSGGGRGSSINPRDLQGGTSEGGKQQSSSFDAKRHRR